MLVHAFFANEEDEDAEHYGIDVIEEVPSESQQQEPISETNMTRLGPTWLLEGDASEQDENYGKPTLRLDLESLEVLDIKSVTYNSDRRAVSRRRYTKSVQDVTNPPF